MGIHKTPIDKDFPELNFKERLGTFCKFLAHDLDKMDIETNWSSEFFTTLDAEVVVNSLYIKSQRIEDLLKAIRDTNKSKALLVLGDPGSGQSVALRKLCRDLLNEVTSTGKIPLYINLKEWEAENTWSEESPPTVKELFSFVKNNIKERGDVFANKFLDEYFDRMFESGRFFIILDSFDEIPAVMDADEASWIIDVLSSVVFDFLSGAHETRGLLASRQYRRPTSKYNAETILEIRPFSEIKIIECFKKQITINEDLITTLFQKFPHLVPLARNPFTNSLIISFLDKNGRFPQNQSEMYENYITERLSECKWRMKQKKFTDKIILDNASEIALAIYSDMKSGLEIEIEKLERRLKVEKLRDTLDILRYARIGRFNGNNNRFSFVHRRFSEYFLARKIIEGKMEIPLHSIPSDSRWRDALALYCEIAPAKDAIDIAKFCWKQVDYVFGAKIRKWKKYQRVDEELNFVFQDSVPDTF